MDFDQYRQAFLVVVGRQIQLLRQREAVHGIHAVEKLDRPLGFIALQMSDQMPSGIQVGEFRVLGLEFLDAILAEVAQACVVRSENRFRRESLRDGDEGDFVSAAPHALSCACDALANVREIRSN